MFVFLFW